MVLASWNLPVEKGEKNANKQTDGQTHRPRAQPRPWSQPRAPASTLIESTFCCMRPDVQLLFTYQMGFWPSLSWLEYAHVFQRAPKVFLHAASIFFFQIKSKVNYELQVLVYFVTIFHLRLSVFLYLLKEHS